MINHEMIPCRGCYNSYEPPTANDVGLCGECLLDLGANMALEAQDQPLVELFTLADLNAITRRPPE